MAGRKTSGIAPEIIAGYSELVASLGMELKGVTMPYTALAGNMFSFLAPDGSLNLRLSVQDRVELIAKGAQQSVQHGALMKEYVVVPKTIWEDDEEMNNYFGRSHAYAQSLKPKATKSK